MLAWKQQGAAFAADLKLLDGRAAKGVVVAGRGNPKGLVFLLPLPDGTMQTLLPTSAAELVSAGDYIEMLFMQERAFGTSGLPAPEVSA